MAQRPKVVDGQAAVRDVLDVTLAIDHNGSIGHRPPAPAPSFETLSSVPPCFRPDPISAGPGRYDATVVAACKVQICIPVSRIDAASAAAPISGSARSYQKHSPPLAV
jgi:hypothetical protein